MKERPWYLIIAILLTVFEVVVAAWYGRLIWSTSSAVVRNWWIHVVMVPVVVSSLASMWIQAFPGLLGLCADWGSIGTPMPAKAWEEGDV